MSLKLAFPWNVILSPFSVLTLFIGQQEGHPACIKLGVGSLVVTIDWSCSRLIAPVVTTISIILSSSTVQNEDILV